MAISRAVRAQPIVSLFFAATAIACKPQSSAAIPPATDVTQPFASATIDEPAPSRKATPQLDAITIPPRPPWTDKYAEAGPDQRRFVISRVMDMHGLSRAQAIEAQNHYRDRARANPDADLDALLAEAIAAAKDGRFEDRRDVERLASARFIVVFDLDDTLYDQALPDDATCHDFEVTHDGRTRKIKLAPGWDATIRRIAQLGGAVVLYSANVDDKTWANARAWMLDGVPIVESPLVSGFLTNSHLVQQDKAEGGPVQEPSKDLRVVDEALTRAVIIDDNPGRIFQPANLRLFKKFNAREYCAATDPAIRRIYDQAMARVRWEVEDSVQYMDAHPGVDFATAYRPFTAIGQVALPLIRDGLRLSNAKAIEWLRKHPSFIDPEF